MSIVITLDGPAGSGKSTAARRLAGRLGFDFLDTGAMYRAVAWKCLSMGIDTREAQRAGEIAAELAIEFNGGRVLADGEDITEAIRTEAVSRASSLVAVHPQVRSALVEKQRDWAEGRSVVSEGRDQGTIVFPAAVCKFFVTASAEIRARRRCDELLARGEAADYNELLREIRERDRRDAGREFAPLKPASDAVRIDTSDRPLEAVVDELERIVRGRIGA